MADAANQNPLLCRNCWYNLQGIESDTCPECGAEFHPRDRDTALTLADAKFLREVGLAQSLTILAVLVGLLGNIVIFVFPFAVVFLIYCVLKLTRALGYHMASRILLAISMVLPLVGLIVLLVLNSRATQSVQRMGGHVGLMGIKRKDLPPAEAVRAA